MTTRSWSIMAYLKTRWSTSLVRFKASLVGKAVEPNFKKARHDQNLLFVDLFSSETFTLQGISFQLSSAQTWTDSMAESPINATLFQTSWQWDLIQHGLLSKQLSPWLTQLQISVIPCQVPHRFVSRLSTNLLSLHRHQVFRRPMKASSFCLICSTSRSSQISSSVVTTNVPIWFWDFRIMQASIPAHTVSLINMELIKVALVNLNLGALSWSKQTVMHGFKSGRPEQDLQHFYNCHHHPFIARSGPTINVVVPSPLHCLIGIVNKIYKELLKAFPQAEAGHPNFILSLKFSMEDVTLMEMHVTTFWKISIFLTPSLQVESRKRFLVLSLPACHHFEIWFMEHLAILLIQIMKTSL